MSTATDIVRTGVTIALAAYDRAAVEDVMHDIAALFGAVYAAGDGDVIATVGFNLGDEMSAVVAGERPPERIDARPELIQLAGGDVAAVVRLEMVTRPGERIAPVRADQALTAAIVALAGRFPLVACDDVGAVYDIEELRLLVAHGTGRFESDAFLVESARRDEQLEAGRDALGVDGLAGLPAQAVLPVAGTRIPTLDWIAALTGPRTAIVGPALDDLDVARLARVGVPFARRFDELSVMADAAVDDRARDELDIYAAVPLTRAAVAEIVEVIALEWAANDAARDGDDAARLTIVSAAPGESALIAPIARATFGDATCSIALVDVAGAGERMQAALRSRGDIAVLLGGDVASIVTVELVAADPVDDIAMRRADAFSVVVADAFARRFSTVAADLGGGTYTPAAIGRLASRRATRDGSWIARVAAAIATQ